MSGRDLFVKRAFLVNISCVSLVAGLVYTSPVSAAYPTKGTTANRTVNDSHVVESATRLLFASDPRSSLLELEPTLVHRLPSGNWVVKFQQNHQGVTVYERGASVVLDRSLRCAISIATKLASDLPSSVVPTLSEWNAAKIASERAGVRFEETNARPLLVWIGGELRLVFSFYQGAIGNLPYAPRVFVDAHDGTILLMQNRVSFIGSAKVHEFNPVSSPSPISVTLPVPMGSNLLSNDKTVSFNCIDKKTTKSLLGVAVHVCVREATAVADSNGDFPYDYMNDTDPEDPHAEVAAYYHTNKAYDYALSIGMPDLKDKPITTIANVRVSQGFDTFDIQKLSDTNLPLVPFTDAFFTPPSPTSPFSQLFDAPGATLYLGQATQGDMAYDGDVIYHEFAHAILHNTVKLESSWHLDEQGASPSPGSMSEGLADLFSSFVSGDSKVGEYGGKASGLPGPIRDIESPNSCPASLTGEVHADSLFFSPAFWNSRKTLSVSEQKVFDEAVMTGLLSAPSGDLGYQDLANLIVNAVQKSSLPSTVVDGLKKALEERGVLPGCKRVFEYQGKPVSSQDPNVSNGFFVPGFDNVALAKTGPFVPGLFQVHSKLSAGTTEVKIQFKVLPLSSGSQGTPFTPALLAQFDNQPISFTYNSGMAQSSAGSAVALQGADDIMSAVVAVPSGATDLSFMIVNKGDSTGWVTALSMEATGTTPMGTGGSAGTAGTATAGTGGTNTAGVAGTMGGSGSANSAGNTSSGAGPSTAAAPQDDGGCGCRMVDGSEKQQPIPLVTGLLLGLTAVLRRRRKA
jgi:hypothetical protein